MGIIPFLLRYVFSLMKLYHKNINIVLAGKKHLYARTDTFLTLHIHRNPDSVRAFEQCAIPYQGQFILLVHSGYNTIL